MNRKKILPYAAILLAAGMNGHAYPPPLDDGLEGHMRLRGLHSTGTGTSTSLDMAGAQREIARPAPYATVKFAQGSWRISEMDKATLQAMLKAARIEGVIRQVVVAAWSDKPLPRHGKSLGSGDRKLADQRLDAVHDFLKSVSGDLEFDAYNLAEQTNWVAKAFHAPAGERKSLFGKSGGEAPLTQDQFATVRKEGGPCRAVVFVDLEQGAPFLFHGPATID